jgi:hypothetical protein
MTRHEVEAILGGPPGDYSLGPTRVSDEVVDAASLNDPKIWRPFQITGVLIPDGWLGDTATIQEHFSRDGIAVEKWLRRCQRQEQDTLENFVWRVRRQWEKWFPV